MNDLSSLPPPILTGSYAAWFLADCAERAYERHEALSLIFAGSKAIWTLRTEIYDPVSEAFAYVITSNATKEIVVAFRGSEGLLDMLWNGWESIKLVPWMQNWGDGIAVHQGWLQMWKSIVDSMWAALRSIIDEFGQQARLYFTGHSRGGALATLASIDICQSLEYLYPDHPAWDISLYTVAAPPVGNVPFAEQFSANMLPRLRACRHFLNAGDAIRLPNLFMMSTPSYLVLRAPYAATPSSNADADALPANAGHAVTNYVDLLASADEPPPCPLWPDELANRVVARIFTGNWNSTPPAAVTLVVGTDEHGHFGVPFRIVNPLRNGQYEYFQQNTTLTIELPIHLERPIAVSEFANCSVVVDACSTDPQAPGWNFGGLQLIVNGVTLYTRWTLNAPLDDINDQHLLDVPVPYPRIVGGRMRATDANHYDHEWLDLYAWGRQSDREQTTSLGYCYTTKWRENSYGKASFFTEPSLARPVVLSGFNEMTTPGGQGPSFPGPTWGPSDHAGTTQVVLNEGYCCGSGKKELYQKTWLYVTEAINGVNPGNPILGGCIRLAQDDGPLDAETESVIAKLPPLSPAGVAEAEQIGLAFSEGNTCQWSWGEKTEHEVLINEWWAYLPDLGKRRTKVYFYFAKSALPSEALPRYEALDRMP